MSDIYDKSIVSVLTDSQCFSRFSSDYKIYEGYHIIARMAKVDYNSFQVKTYINQPYIDFKIDQVTPDHDYYVESLVWWFGPPKDKIDTRDEFFFFSTDNELVKRITREYVRPGNWYILTVRNRYHQQQFMPEVLAVNFDIEKRKLLQTWRSDQNYPGCPVGDYEFDEWGAPVPCSK